VERSERLSPDAPVGAALDRALDDVMALPNLVALFGREATANPVEEFSRHFGRRIRHVVATSLATNNPWLTQMLLGRFAGTGMATVESEPVQTEVRDSPARRDRLVQPSEGGCYPWLLAPAPGRMPEVRFANTTMQLMIESAEAGAWDIIHLSNILDWQTPEQSAQLLERAHQALAPAGRIVIRQLNSNLRVPEAGQPIRWLPEEAARLHAVDRSFFYRELHIGTKG
jgi:S-adenosylmethionine-diacylglycerol 3-amino-3-carboxypropyl transferase